MGAEAGFRNAEEILSQFVIRKMQYWTPADDMIYKSEDFLDIPPDEAERQQFEAIRYAFDYHYSKNAFYRHFCQLEGMKPDDIKTSADFIKIPKIPDTFFKEYPTTSSKELWDWLKKTSATDIGEFDLDPDVSFDDLFEEIYSREKGVAVHSGGTTGKFSIIFKNWQGAGRWGYIVTKTLLGIAPLTVDAHAVYLGPSRSYLGLGWLGASLDRIFPASHIHYSIDRRLTMKMLSVAVGIRRGMKEGIMLYLMRRALVRARSRMAKLLQHLDKAGKQVYLISTPYDIYYLMLELKKRGIRLSLGETNSVVITSAGWKMFEKDRISMDLFREMGEDTLGIPQKNFRDIYGMAEWHGFAWECEGHYKHIIQSTYPMVLDENLQMVGFNKYGRFAFLDPLSYTFPGFIITGDRVKMLPKCPACKRTSPVLEPEITRMPGASPRGCGELVSMMMKERSGEIA